MKKMSLMSASIAIEVKMEEENVKIAKGGGDTWS
jgi:hypothetical protein